MFLLQKKMTIWNLCRKKIANASLPTYPLFKLWVEEGSNQLFFSMALYHVNIWLLFNAMWAIFQFYHGKNKVHFDELMMMSVLALDRHT
jgi:hypothetical protein